MSLTATFQVAGDLLVQADKVRADHPDVAAALEGDSYRLLTAVPSVSVAEAAGLLGQSRPTIYEWIKTGLLLTQEANAKGVSISPESLITIIPILREWEEEGREGRPSRFLREWLDGALVRRQRRQEFAAQRRVGPTAFKPPSRRATAAELVGSNH